ncbi:MAG: class I SAM-dependent methyltransferase [Bernardetiaceae bacterium]
MVTENTFWEEDIYSKGHHLNKYPYDNVVSFVFRSYSRSKPREQIQILEVGCGAGNNLWFAAKEGFCTTGIDLSPSAISFCKKRFEREKLVGRFVIGSFVELPFDENAFDLVIDRASLTCCGFEEVQISIENIHRVLKTGGKFFFNAYSTAHTSFGSGVKNPNGTWANMQQGTLAGIEHIYFFSPDEIASLFPASDWQIISQKHKEVLELSTKNVHAEWEIILEKI